MNRRDSWFGVRLILECQIDGSPDSTLEDRIVVVRASDETAAQGKAAALVGETPERYANDDGEKVEWVVREVLDAVPVWDDAIEDGTEVYHRFIGPAELETLRKLSPSA